MIIRFGAWVACVSVFGLMVYQLSLKGDQSNFTASSHVEIETEIINFPTWWGYSRKSKSVTMDAHPGCTLKAKVSLTGWVDLWNISAKEGNLEGVNFTGGSQHPRGGAANGGGNYTVRTDSPVKITALLEGGGDPNYDNPNPRSISGLFEFTMECPLCGNGQLDRPPEECDRSMGSEWGFLCESCDCPYPFISDGQGGCMCRDSEPYRTDEREDDGGLFNQGEWIWGCPCTDANCMDDNPCTRDFCRHSSNQCGHEWIHGCCHDVSDCGREVPLEDGWFDDPCTTNFCNNGQCQYEDNGTCCNSNDECQGVSPLCGQCVEPCGQARWVCGCLTAPVPGAPRSCGINPNQPSVPDASCPGPDVSACTGCNPPCNICIPDPDDVLCSMICVRSEAADNFAQCNTGGPNTPPPPPPPPPPLAKSRWGD